MEEKQSKFWDFYNKNYKKLLMIPMIVLIVSILLIYNFYRINGDIINKEVSLKGGITATVYYKDKIDVNGLNNFLIERFNNADINTRVLSSLGTSEVTGFIIETSDIKPDEFKKALEERLNIKLDGKNYSIEEVGSSLGESFYKELITAVLIAFIFMAIVIFITFRTLAPSAAVVLSALIDIVIPLAIINLLNIKVSSAGVVAFLLLIGYSVDTDILLTTRALKRYNAPLFDRMYSSMKTGLTMTFCAIAVMVTGIILSTTPIIKEMFFIILLGLITDIFSTYFTNASILKIYCKRKNIA